MSACLFTCDKKCMIMFRFITISRGLMCVIYIVFISGLCTYEMVYGDIYFSFMSACPCISLVI